MPPSSSNPDQKVPDVEQLANVFGGQYFVQSGQNEVDGLGPRRYWRVHQAATDRRGPAIHHAQQIDNSWAMRGSMEARPPRWRLLDRESVVVYLLAGRGEVWFEDRRIKVAAGDLFAVPRGVRHVYGPDAGTRWDEISCHVIGRVFDSWLRPGLLDPKEPVRQLLPVGDWLERFHAVLAPLARPEAVQGPEHWAGLIGVWAAAAGQRGRRSQGDADWLARAIAAIRAEPPRPQLDLDRVAAKLGISERTMRRRFTRLTGETPHQHHSRNVMDRARAMLGAGESLATIADELGFPNPYYFSRRFKQVTGQTASAYREELRHR